MPQLVLVILICYIAVGLINVIAGVVTKTLMISIRPDAVSASAAFEVAFYLLLWPIQLLFKIFILMHVASHAVLSRIFN